MSDYVAKEQRVHTYRFILVVLLMVSGLAAVLAKAYWNRFSNEHHQKYLKQAHQYVVRDRVHLAPRADIVDRHGQPLAISNQRSMVILEPKNFLVGLEKQAEELYKDCEKIARRQSANPSTPLESIHKCQWLSPSLALGSDASKKAFSEQYQEARWQQLVDYLNTYRIYPTSVDELKAKVHEIAKRDKNRGSNYFLLNSDVMGTVAAELNKMDFVGLRKEDGFDRYYPQKELFAQVVGYTEKLASMPSIKDTLQNNAEYFAEGKGIAGLEQQYDDRLRSASGLTGVYHGGKKVAISGIAHESKATRFGQDLVLSLDARIQHVVHDVLQSAYQNPATRAKAMMAVVLDVETSEVLAMQSLPVGNPNQLSARQPDLMRNRVLTDVYEMGSIHKPIAMLAALELGKITPHTSFKFPANCIRQYGKHSVRDVGRCTPNMSATTIIARSSNVGMSYIADRVPRKYYLEFLKRLGFAQKSELNFVGERTGYLPYPSSEHQYAIMYFGYGETATLMQMANAYVMIANGGIKRPLSLLKKEQIEAGERVMREQTSRNMRSILRATVMSDEGTAKNARTPSYTTAGKTGTSRKADVKRVVRTNKDGSQTVVNKGGYSRKYLSSFIGYAPADKPRIVVAVLVDEPMGVQYYGGAVAAPLFAQIVERSLPLLGVVSDKLDKNHSIKVERIVPLAMPAEEKKAQSATDKPTSKASPKGTASNKANSKPKPTKTTNSNTSGKKSSNASKPVEKKAASSPKPKPQ